MKIINILTHSGSFHSDDIFATALLNLYFKYKEPKTKLKLKRSILQKDIDKADIVYDIGLIYDAKKLRFDHHQNDDKLIRSNGIPYAAFGLVFKHFGPELISLISKNKNKKYIKDCFDIVEKKLIQHLDAMDNGKLTYECIFENVDIITIDNYFQMCRSTIDVNTPKDTNKKFNELVKFSIPIIENIILYSTKMIEEKDVAINVYKKSKDKRVIVCDRYYNFNYNKFPEPLFVIYPDTRGGWSAKVVEKGEKLYDARFYFPKSWWGLIGEDLEKFTKIKGAKFCHKSGFLCVNNTKEGILEMVYKTLKK